MDKEAIDDAREILDALGFKPRITSMKLERTNSHYAHVSMSGYVGDVPFIYGYYVNGSHNPTPLPYGSIKPNIGPSYGYASIWMGDGCKDKCSCHKCTVLPPYRYYADCAIWPNDTMDDKEIIEKATEGLHLLVESWKEHPCLR